MHLSVLPNTYLFLNQEISNSKPTVDLFNIQMVVVQFLIFELISQELLKTRLTSMNCVTSLFVNFCFLICITKIGHISKTLMTSPPCNIKLLEEK